MKRLVKALQFLHLELNGFGRFGLVFWLVAGHAIRTLIAAVRGPGGPGQGARSARGATPMAPLRRDTRPADDGGGQGCGAAARWWRSRAVGVACRGGVVAVATATLICACRDRRSVLRRMVPLTNYEGWGYLNSARGGRSCGGERPGRPPAQGDCQLVISAQTKPASSRAIAVTATPAGLPRAVMVLYLACSLRCACQERASVCGLASCWRRRRVTPIAGRNRYAQAASIRAVRAGSDPALVIEPRRVRSPLEYSAGTSPVNPMNARGDGKRRQSTTSAARTRLVSSAMPR